MGKNGDLPAQLDEPKRLSGLEKKMVLQRVEKKINSTALLAIGKQDSGMDWGNVSCVRIVNKRVVRCSEEVIEKNAGLRLSVPLGQGEKPALTSDQNYLSYTAETKHSGAFSL